MLLKKEKMSFEAVSLVTKERAPLHRAPFFPSLGSPLFQTLSAAFARILFYKKEKKLATKRAKKRQASKAKLSQYGTFLGRFRLTLAARFDRSVSLIRPLCCAFLACLSFLAARGTSASLTPMAL